MKGLNHSSGSPFWLTETQKVRCSYFGGRLCLWAHCFSFPYSLFPWIIKWDWHTLSLRHQMWRQRFVHRMSWKDALGTSWKEVREARVGRGRMELWCRCKGGLPWGRWAHGSMGAWEHGSPLHNCPHLGKEVERAAGGESEQPSARQLLMV